MAEPALRIETLTMTIDGRPAAIAGTFGVVNPATGRVFTEAPECTRQQLDAAMASAAQAYRSWSRDEDLRRSALRRCSEVFKANAEEIAAILTSEQGKPLPQAVGEVHGAAAWFDYTATLPIPVEVVADTDVNRIEVRRRPLGVVAAITPWNYPLILAVWKIAPALLAGNTVVVKPSPFTPLSTLKAGELLRSVLPPGVLNVVAGGDDLGAWMTSHPVPRKISFTGSVATGKKVAPGGGAGPQAAHARARRQRRRDRDAGHPGRRGGQGPVLGRVPEQRPGVQRDQAALRPRAAGAADDRRAQEAGAQRQDGRRLRRRRRARAHQQPAAVRARDRAGRGRARVRRRGPRRRSCPRRWRLLLRAHHSVRGQRGRAHRRRGAVRSGAAGAHLLGRRRRRRARERDQFGLSGSVWSSDAGPPPRSPADSTAARPGSTSISRSCRSRRSAAPSGRGSGSKTVRGDCSGSPRSRP